MLEESASLSDETTRMHQQEIAALEKLSADEIAAQARTLLNEAMRTKDAAHQQEIAALKGKLSTCENRARTLEDSVSKQNALLEEAIRKDAVHQREIMALKEKLGTHENAAQARMHDDSVSQQKALLEEAMRTKDAAHQQEIAALKKKLSAYENASAGGRPRQGAGSVTHRRRSMTLSAYAIEVCSHVQ
jgi:hypothetical protein